MARDLGINPNRLSRWRQEEHHAAARGTTPGALKAEAEELARLKRELETVKKERDFSYGPVLSRGPTSFLTVSRAWDCFLVNASHRIRNAANRLCIDDGSSSYSRVG